MKILVFVKQIPEISRIEFDPKTKRIVRDKVPLIINPFDKRAVEEGIRIKEKIGGEVVVATMGPPSAADVLNNSLRMGADRAILISDPAYAGSDTWVTSRILSLVTKKISPDIVLLGKYSLDGETSQVPPEVAILSGYSYKTSVSRIEVLSDNGVNVEQETEDGLEVYRMKFPLLVSVSEKINRARFVKPEIPDMSSRIEKWSAADVGGSITGSMSPTVVESTEIVESKRKVSFLNSVDEISKIIFDTLQSGKKNADFVLQDPPDIDQERFALVVSAGDARVTYEIAGKLSSLGVENNHAVVVAGQQDPQNFAGLSCNEYVHIKTDSLKAYTDEIVKIIRNRKPQYVVFPSNVKGREVAAAVAAKFEIGLTADCVDLKLENNRLIQFKPAFGGGMVARITTKTRPEMATVRPGIFRLAKTEKKFKVSSVEPDSTYSDIPVSIQKVDSQFKSLQGARIVVGIGKGLIKKDNVALAMEFASKVGAAIGGTRPIVDLNWLPRQQQIGLTGYSISPDLYIAIGISGHDNHVVGTRYAKTIVSINKDKNAPVFNYSDYGYISDSIEFLNSVLKST